VCLRIGVTVREVSPSWSKRESWREAFISNGLKLVQHVEAIEAPTVWPSNQLISWKGVSWETKEFKGGPGRVTTAIQREILKNAALEGYPLSMLCSGGIPILTLLYRCKELSRARERNESHVASIKDDAEGEADVCFSRP
ncbi:hypothetical protein V2J09_016500, partial [Rumex salicifolius]